MMGLTSFEGFVIDVIEKN